jgi:hypothetical protein
MDNEYDKSHSKYPVYDTSVICKVEKQAVHRFKRGEHYACHDNDEPLQSSELIF